MFSAGFEPTIPASERPKVHDKDRAAIGLGFQWPKTRNVIFANYFLRLCVAVPFCEEMTWWLSFEH